MRRKTTLARITKGFTLIELLIVIGTIAILAAIVVLVINPVELLRRGRDATRLQDLQTVNRALDLYDTDVKNKNFGDAAKIYLSLPAANPDCSGLTGLPPAPAGWSYACSSPANYRKVNNSGWIPVNFQDISFGTPLSSLPVDPVNDAAQELYYIYTTGGSWELNARMESQKFQELPAKDNGNDAELLEVGTSLTLAPKFQGVIVNSISPISGNSNGATIADISGSGFKAGAEVKLVKAGQADIFATGFGVAPTSITGASFNINHAKPGAWDVVVMNPDGKSGTLTGANGFSVIAAEENTGYLLGSTFIKSTSPAWTAGTDPTSGWFTDEEPASSDPFDHARTLVTSASSPWVRFSGFNFGIPAGSVISRICVLVDDAVRTSAGAATLRWGVQLSWDGGVNFTLPENTVMVSLTTTKTDYYFFSQFSAPLTTDPGTSCTPWGRIWPSSQMSSTNFAVRARAISFSTSNNEIRFDVVKVKVYYTQQ